MNDLMQTPPSLLTRTRNLTWLTVASLVVLYAYINFTSERGSLTLWVIASATLLMFVPGMLMEKAKTYDWLCFVTLVHFISATTDSMSPQGGWTDYLQLVLTVILFTSSMLTSRWLKAWQYHLSQS